MLFSTLKIVESCILKAYFYVVMLIEILQFYYLKPKFPVLDMVYSYL